MTDRLRAALSFHADPIWFMGRSESEVDALRVVAAAARAVVDAPVLSWCRLHDLPMCDCGADEAHCLEGDESIAPCVLVTRLLVDPGSFE